MLSACQWARARAHWASWPALSQGPAARSQQLNEVQCHTPPGRSSRSRSRRRCGPALWPARARARPGRLGSTTRKLVRSHGPRRSTDATLFQEYAPACRDVRPARAAVKPLNPEGRGLHVLGLSSPCRDTAHVTGDTDCQNQQWGSLSTMQRLGRASPGSSEEALLWVLAVLPSCSWGMAGPENTCRM